MRTLLLILLFPLSLFAQYDVSDDLKHATVVIRADGWAGSGSIVEYNGEKFILTAAHVVHKPLPDNSDTSDTPRDKIVVFFWDLTFKQMTVSEADIENDVALLTGEIPENVKTLKLSEHPAKFMDSVQMLVRSGGSAALGETQLRRGLVSPSVSDRHVTISNYRDILDPEYKMAEDGWIQPGDSGGALLNARDEIVGVCIAGNPPLFDIENGRGETVRGYWPALATGLSPIKRLFERPEPQVDFQTYSDFVKAQDASPGVYYIMVSATWCAPCQRLKVRLTNEVRATIYVIDYDEKPTVANSFLKGRGLPLLLRVQVERPGLMKSVEAYDGGDLRRFFGER